ncbi:hypothetical protein ANCCEY_00218 [Ancylostoma ceylanicum]|uniref:7TM GPCR serpentine receptor class x (Srx) domain-containing protein n=1 Tax=Ancylostoma ceylanicum TaxID=53326 RepID=A0A0D6M942_9BILA|nr:hypothetical protein ANCCEY_00218 [Ancylostoma ceylanicum]
MAEELKTCQDTIASIYDMASIVVNSLLSGYLWIIGANYCTNPNLIFISGSVGLVINRILELWNKPLMMLAFGEGRAYAALLIPFLYGLYFCFFTQPLIFNSDNSSWFFFTYTPNHSPDESIKLESALLSSFSGFPAVVYILLNRTIQKEVLTLLGLRKPIVPTTMSSTPVRTMFIQHQLK